MKKKVFAALMSLFVASAVFAVVNIVVIQVGYAAAQSEYEDLSSARGNTKGNSRKPQGDSGVSFDLDAESEFTASMRKINPDYVGWISIDSIGIDYPIVQGMDNSKYLSTTFQGAKNPSGAIFMDSRCADSFNGYVILYGHNMNDGTMFAPLAQLLNRSYRDNYPKIAITMPDDTVVYYNIYNVRVTNVFDIAYKLPFLGGKGKLVLSTCTESDDRAERLVVMAEMEG